jgi:hypothetical protein
MEEENLPVCEFVTTIHTSWAVCHHLEHLTVTCDQPKVVVTDFSYAIINAVLMVFNKCDLTMCLKVTFRHMMTADENTGGNVTCLIYIKFVQSTHNEKFFS